MKQLIEMLLITFAYMTRNEKLKALMDKAEQPIEGTKLKEELYKTTSTACTIAQSLDGIKNLYENDAFLNNIMATIVFNMEYALIAIEDAILVSMDKFGTANGLIPSEYTNTPDMIRPVKTQLQNFSFGYKTRNQYDVVNFIAKFHKAKYTHYTLERLVKQMRDYICDVILPDLNNYDPPNGLHRTTEKSYLIH